MYNIAKRLEKEREELLDKIDKIEERQDKLAEKIEKMTPIPKKKKTRLEKMEEKLKNVVIKGEIR